MPGLLREKRKRERESGSAEQPATDEDLVIEYYVVCAPGEYTSTYIRQTPEIVQSGRRRGLGKGTIIAEVIDGGDVVGRWGRELADGSVVPVTSGARTFVTFQGGLMAGSRPTLCQNCQTTKWQLIYPTATGH